MQFYLYLSSGYQSYISVVILYLSSMYSQSYLRFYLSV